MFDLWLIDLENLTPREYKFFETIDRQLIQQFEWKQEEIQYPSEQSKHAINTMINKVIQEPQKLIVSFFAGEKTRTHILYVEDPCRRLKKAQDYFFTLQDFSTTEKQFTIPEVKVRIPAITEIAHFFKFVGQLPFGMVELFPLSHHFPTLWLALIFINSICFHLPL